MPDLNDQHHNQFLRLFAEHEPALRTFVRSLRPSRADASEVMQEVAVVLWQKFAEFDVSQDFRKWAFGVARFEALAYLRDRAREHRSNVGVATTPVAPTRTPRFQLRAESGNPTRSAERHPLPHPKCGPQVARNHGRFQARCHGA